MYQRVEVRVPDKAKNQSLAEIASAYASAPAGEDSPVTPRLPIEEYAITVPTEITRSVIVISGSPGLACRNKVPVQIFPAEGILRGELSVRASKDELRRAGLEDLFKPDPESTVYCLPLPYEGLTDTYLLCKLRPNHSLDHVKTICNRQADDIRAMVDRNRGLVSQYEWQVLKTVFLSTAPCLAVDASQRVVAANPMICELTERVHSQLVGTNVDDVIHMEKEVTGDIARYPDYTELTSPLFMRTLSAFFVSDLQLSVLDTVCGELLVVAFRDLLTDQRTGNSNIHLIRKLSAMVMSEDPPQKVLRRLSNVLTSALDCDLVCILRRKQNDEMIVTPYVNRSLHTLRANIIERVKEPLLEPFFKKGSAVFCDQVEQECSQDSFFRRVLRISRFAFLPAGVGPHPEYALLMAWTRRSADFGPRVLPLLRIIANLMASVLVSAKRFFEMEQEKEALRRHVKLTAGREVRMAELKKENTRLKDMVRKLSEKVKV